jgi:transketolase
VLCGDGCLEEGISYEACSFAGANGLGKLILIYDDNDITIEGNTDITFKENVGARFAAQNWQVLHVDLTGESNDDVVALSKALEAAKARTDKPSIVICRTNIGYGSPLQDTAKCHGAPLGMANLQKAKEKLGWEYAPFECPEEVYAHCKLAAQAGMQAETQWNKMFAEYEATYPELAAVLWEDEEYDRTKQKNLQVYIASLVKTLHSVEVKDLILRNRQGILVNTKIVDCDYYRFLEGDTRAINSFTGQYMSAYSWAEFTVGYLENQIQKITK